MASPTIGKLMTKVALISKLEYLRSEALHVTIRSAPYSNESINAQQKYDALTIAIYLVENHKLPEA